MKNELKDLQIKIEINKRMLECLELRLHYIDSNRVNKSDYELNEDDIIKITTNTKIDFLNDKISELENEFINLL
jgi:hypothetical protein